MHWGTLRDTVQEKQLFQTRAFVAILGVVVITLSLLGRFYYLQVIAHETYTTPCQIATVCRFSRCRQLAG